MAVIPYVSFLSRIGNAIASPFRSKQGTKALARADLAAIVELVRSQESARQRRLYTRQSENWNGIVDRTIGVRLRWTPTDRERILSMCESGDMYSLGLFLDAMRANGTVYGLMSTRNALLRLPLQWTGDPFLIEWLRGADPEFDANTGALLSSGHESDFSKIFPLSELDAILWDGDLAGIGVGEFVPCPNGGLPKLRHLDLHWLRYEWSTERWLYSSPYDTYEVRPGDGRWFFYTPYGLSRPWLRAPWLACALPVIAAHSAILDRLRWQQDHADPLKLITVGTDRIEKDFADLDNFAFNDWHRSPHLILRSGETAEIVEGSGQGYEVYKDAEASANDEIARALAGQTATSGEGASWSKGNIWADIAQSIIANSAEKLAEAIHFQGLRPYAQRMGRAPYIWCRWDCRSPDQKMADAEALKSHAESIEAADKVLAPRGLMVDIEAYSEAQGLVMPSMPITKSKQPAALPDPNVIDAEYEIPVDTEEPDPTVGNILV